MKNKQEADFIKELLEEKVKIYNRTTFIPDDPVSIPHSFSKREDIEIAGFFSATIAWGQRPTIIRNAQQLMQIMYQDPYEFVMHAKASDLKRLNTFVHRTFNADDVKTFVLCLRNLYEKHGGMESVFQQGLDKTGNMMDAISYFRNTFFSSRHLKRTEKHVSDPASGSSAKRINMFLRWMVRKDRNGVDFGIWNSLSPALLMCPLDVHVGNVARELGLLHRKQNDRKAVEELTAQLRVFDPADPVKYDFALFSIGVNEKTQR
ncbi:MAG: TIGR02757 family protein [Bacteroidia bacterium]